MKLRKFSRKELTNSIFLYLIFLSILLALSFFRQNSGYMDEAYYLLTARNLSQGQGFQENILWNFMDDPAGLPHPSHLYWMPLTSIFAAAGMVIFGPTYFAACLPLSLIGAMIAPAMYLLLFSWLRDHFWAIIGAVLAMAGGYYLVYYSAVDAFSLYMLLGFGYFIAGAKIIDEKGKDKILAGIFAGLCAGFLHLTRAEGLLWAGFIPILFLVAWFLARNEEERKPDSYLWGAALGMGVYGLLMSPWFFRNLELFNSLTAMGSTSNLLLTTYNDLFIFPASELTFERWLSVGAETLLQHRLKAAGVNLLSIIGVQMLIVQVPLIFFGIRKYWRFTWVKVNVIGLAVLFLFFSVVFPLAGARGSFFHASTVFQIFLWSMSVLGLREIISRLPLKEDIDRSTFTKFLGIGFLVLILAISGVLTVGKLNTWTTGTEELVAVDRALSAAGIARDETILINDPATFNWVSERPSIVIPSGDEDMMREVMDHYGVRYAVLQINHPPELAPLYQHPEDSKLFEVLLKDQTWFVLEKVGNGAVK